MEKEALAKLMVLKGIKGYGNKRVLDIVKSSNNLDSAFDLFIKKSLVTENDLSKQYDILIDCERNKINILTYFDRYYPENLKLINYPPLILFTKGNLSLLSKPSISIVGTRQASNYTIEWTYRIAQELANAGYSIISGGALGIDFVAHKGALDSNGNTICVLGCGLNNIYPKDNSYLIDEISNKGLVISEYSPRAHVNRFSLLERNRITSGLGDRLILVSTKLSGGAMSQYKVAVSQKKEIFCPNPNLKLEPVEGIIKVCQENKNVRIISNAMDILNSPSLQKKIPLESFAN